MKRHLLFLFGLIISISLLADVPQGISHQAVMRDADNNLIVESPIGLQVSILQGTHDGDAVYVETHNVTTNTNGLITYIIGNGSVVTGVFEEIDWGAGPYWLETKADPVGGTNYTISGVTQFLSVPYALHAQSAQSAAVAETVIGSVSHNIQPPTVLALDADPIEEFSATINGIVNGEGFLTTVVFEWGTTPSYGNTVTAIPSPVSGSDDVQVSAVLSNLQAATTYHYRIKASNAVDIIYSEYMSFTTGASVPQLTTNPITSITPFSANSGGNITYDGGLPVIQRGVVWSTESNPTIDNHEGITNDGEGGGSFTSELTELSPGTFYYVRAYAINEIGTAYGNEITFTTYSLEDPQDIDGNYYRSVIIGNQRWMAENLRVTKYNNGVAIPTGLSDEDWSNTTSGAYAIYDHNHGDADGINSPEEMVAAYGKLYNWYAVDDSRGLCPQGWSVPSDDDWTQLEQYICNALGNSDCETHFPYDNTTTSWRGTNEGNALKSCRQVGSPLEECNISEHPRWDSDGTHYGFDEFGFSALPGGNYSNMYYGIGWSGNWWSSSESSSTIAYRRLMSSTRGGVARFSGSKELGWSVRCIKNSE